MLSSLALQTRGKQPVAEVSLPFARQEEEEITSFQQYQADYLALRTTRGLRLMEVPVLGERPFFLQTLFPPFTRLFRFFFLIFDYCFAFSRLFSGCFSAFSDVFGFSGFFFQVQPVWGRRQVYRGERASVLVNFTIQRCDRAGGKRTRRGGGFEVRRYLDCSDLSRGERWVDTSLAVRSRSSGLLIYNGQHIGRDGRGKCTSV
jgi:hypothetical protein